MSVPLRPRVRLGTRASRLAMVQAHFIAGRLRDTGIAGEVEFVELSTLGDRTQDRPLHEVWGTGVFTRELDDALTRGDIDCTIHSLKDLPVERPAALATAIVDRVDARDALLLRAGEGTTLMDLPPNALVGTSSPRRVAQLRAVRSDLRFTGVRGNVDTRVRKLDEGEIDALMLAGAGLGRLGLAARITTLLDPAVCTPAPGQGALALESRRDDRELTAAIAERLHQLGPAAEITAERGFLAGLGGGCRVPVGAHAVADGDALHLRGVIADPASGDLWRAEMTGEREHAADLGAALAARDPRGVAGSPAERCGIRCPALTHSFRCRSPGVRSPAAR